ncbi:MAG: UDP-2,3-diacylglucosamine diphosphatase, partial [Chloroflexi bacterium]
MPTNTNNSSSQHAQARAFAARYVQRIARWWLTLLIRLTIAVALLFAFRWIVLRFRRVRIRPTAYA